MTRTIRFRVTAMATLLAAGLLVIVALVLVTMLKDQLVDNLDEGLNQRADTIAAVLANSADVRLNVDEDLLIQVVDRSGEPVISSTNFTGSRPLATTPGFVTTSDVPGRTETFRLLARTVDRRGDQATLIIGVNFDDVTEPVRIVTWLLGVAVPVVVFVFATLVWWLTGRTLRPVEKMRSEMADISGSNPERRIHEPGTGDEIDRLARTMNGTLARLDDALSRQRRFAADASHELRSPLTRIRSELELGIANPVDSDAAAVHASVLAETIELQHLVEDLLHLARADAGVEPIAHELIDLDDVVLREARRLTDRGRVDVRRQVEAVQVRGDAKQLGRALRNLLDNAERHAGGVVSVQLSQHDGVAELLVSDDGAGIPLDQRERVFERFARLDEARSRDIGGSGLGLTITRDIVERHGGTIRLAHTDVGQPGSTFVVEIPSSQRP